MGGIYTPDLQLNVRYESTKIRKQREKKTKFIWVAG